jgi:ParB family transcriptional regulator, chromosome partitioning protein
MAKKLVFANNPLLSGPALTQREGFGIPYREVSLSALDRDSNQPRTRFDEEDIKELAQSIKMYGVLNPVLVRPGKLPGRFQIIAGERRVRAAIEAGLSVIPVIVDTSQDDDGSRTLAMQLVENIHRSDLAPLERATAISALKETYQLSVREVADRIGISKSMVQRSLDILELPDDLLNALRQGASESKVLMLAQIADPAERAKYLEGLDTLSRKDLEAKIRGAVTPRAKTSNLSPEDGRIADEIQRALGLRVMMTRSASDCNRGKLMIEFYSEEDLQEVFRKLVAD